MIKSIFLLLLLSFILNANDFERDLKAMQNRDPKELSDLKKYLINFNIRKQDIKDGKFILKIRATLEERYNSYLDVISTSGLRVYKDGKAVYDSRGTTVSSKKVKEDKGGNWVAHTVVDYTYIDKLDGKHHNYIVSFHRISDSSGNFFCMLDYKKVKANPKELKTQIKQIKNVIDMIRRDILRAQIKCKKDMDKVKKEIEKLDKLSKEEKEKIDYKSKVAEFKHYTIVMTNRIVSGECEVDMGYGKVLVKDAQKKIDSYLKEIQKMNKELIGDIDENNIDSVSQKYYDNFNYIHKDKLQKIHQELLTKVDTLVPNEKLLSYFDSLGFTTPKKDDKEAINKWRKKIKQVLKKGWIYSLSTNDAFAVKNELKKHIKILNKFRDASKLSSDASYKILKANQEYTTDVITSIPGVDVATDVISMVSGEDLAGRKLTALDYIMNLTPSALTALMKNKVIKKVMKKTASKVGASGKALKNKLAKRLKVVFEKVDTIPSKVYKSDKNVINTYKKLVKTVEKTSDLKIKKLSKEIAQKSIDNFEKALKSSDEKSIKKAIVELYSNKSAKNIIKNSKKYEDIEKKLVRKIEDIYQKVDKQVIDKLNDNKKLKKYLKAKYGIDSDKVEFFTDNITNAKKKISLGSDRDVTFYAWIKKDGIKQKVEIPHDFVEKSYKEEFFAAFDMDKSKKSIDKFAEEMEQLVTSSKHSEAYFIDEYVDLKDFFAKNSTSTFSNIEDMRKVVMLKSQEFFNKAKKIESIIQSTSDKNLKQLLKVEQMQEMTEGMRQAVKQYKKLVKPRALKYFKSKKYIPKKLQLSMDLYSKVVEGAMTPQKAELIIKKAFGLNTNQTLTLMANYLAKLEGGISKTYRKSNSLLLKNILTSKTVSARAKSFKDGITIMSNMLKKGDIYKEDFLKHRKEFFSSFKKRLKNLTIKEQINIKEEIKSWSKNAMSSHLITREEFASLSKGIL